MTEAKKLETPEGLPDLSAADVKAAKAEGIKQALAESAKREFAQSNGTEAEEPPAVIQLTNDAMHLADMLEMQPDDLKKRLLGKDESQIMLKQGTIASLLEMERSGENRTDIVKVLCDVLGIDSPYEVTDAGPAWTNRVDRDVVKPRA